MKHYLFLILLLLISCKKNEVKKEIIPKDEILDLRYEVLNYLIKNDSIISDVNHFIYSSTLSPVNVDIDDDEIRPLGVDLKYDSIFLQKDSTYYRSQEKTTLNFKFDKNNIKSNLKYTTEQELHKLDKIKNSDFWTEFNKKYGQKCIRRFSVPFFNNDRSMCIVQNSISCGFLNANGYTAIYKKINGKWIEISSFDHWVS